MSYINTTTPTRVWINGKEYTEFLLNGSVSDESSLSNSIIKTTGTIALGGVHDSLIMQEFPLPIGSEVIIQCTLPNNYSTRHPRGTLYLINTTINYEQQTVNLEVGCSLALASTYENSFREKVKSLYSLIPESYDVFQVEDFDLSELDSVLESLGYIMYQDKNGYIQCVKVFGDNRLGATYSSPKFTCYDTWTALSVESLSESSTLIDPESLTITMSYEMPVYEPPDPEEDDTGVDIDDDGLGSEEDADDDNDGVNDEDDRDTDGDGIPNGQDPDIDGDGIPNNEDPDMDGDGILNGPDPDENADGIPDETDEEDDKEEPEQDRTLIDKSYFKTKVYRIADVEKCLQGYDGKKTRIKDLSKKIYSCGKYLNPEYIVDPEERFKNAQNTDVCKTNIDKKDEDFEETEEFYAYEVTGKIELEEVYISDYSEKFQYAEYEGPGNQLSFEKTWENLNIWRFADAAIGQWLDNVSKEYDLVIEEANAKCQEMNEYAEIRDENNYYLKTRLEQGCLSAKERRTMVKTYQFYDCLFASRLAQRDELIAYALEVRNVAARGLNYLLGWRGDTNIEEKYTEFGKGGEVIKQTSKSIVHAGASKYTVDVIKRAGEVLEDPEEQTGPIVDERKTQKFGKYNFGPPLEYITAVYLEGGKSIGNITYPAWPRTFLRSETIDERIHQKDGTVEQITRKIDYENPDNNTLDYKLSTDNSTAAPAQPRNGNYGVSYRSDKDGDGIPDDEDPDIDGDGIPNAQDPDPDGDGIDNENQGEPDSDGDGIINTKDPDIDNDGLPQLSKQEAQCYAIRIKLNEANAINSQGSTPIEIIRDQIRIANNKINLLQTANNSGCTGGNALSEVDKQQQLVNLLKQKESIHLKREQETDPVAIENLDAELTSINEIIQELGGSVIAAEPEWKTAFSDSDKDIDGDGISNEFDDDIDGDGALNGSDADADSDGILDDEDEVPFGAEGNQLACNIPTETKEIIYTIKGANTTRTIAESWLGDFQTFAEEISMPIAFKPIVPENLQPPVESTELTCKITTDQFIEVATANIGKYESYINRYLAIAMAKKMMDNRGVRVVEKMRPEVFDYYPFMPMTIVLQANKKTMLASVSSASWAFDSTNALCSFDCYVIS